ncbi:hypothetical protein SBOR_7909 [Sclerotinia borealis F-4128]|uniref:2EXR domain-containing protein n=1 Tax=Sclerotinia borealis (strain F-4128) TaxID=1432307 RepID=W9CA23_SCLBF|nr:hypothetical protein SBOR_7909 [Sclerotinia borealis F-4128]
MNEPCEDDLPVVWTLEEAEVFEKLQKDMEEATDNDYLTFFQKIHTKGIASRFRDWITSVTIKLNHDYGSSVAIRNVIIYQLVHHHHKRFNIMKSRSERPDMGKDIMYALSQKMVDLQDQLVASEQGLVLNSNLIVTAEAVMTCAKRFVQKMENIPEDFFESRMSYSNSQSILCSLCKLSQRAFFETQFDRFVSNNIEREESERKSWENRRRMDQLAYLPGPDAINLFKAIWPPLRSPLSGSYEMHHFNSPRGATDNFPQFSRLPLEVRYMIWKAELPKNGRIIFTEESRPEGLPWKWTQEARYPRPPLHLICKESYEAMKQVYTFTIELMRNYRGKLDRDKLRRYFDVGGDNWKDIPRLDMACINPDRDIVYRGSSNGHHVRDNMISSSYWTRKLFGLAQVKHLALNMDFVYDAFHEPIIENCIKTTRIKTEQLDRLEASCPNLESLTITCDHRKYAERHFGHLCYLGQSFKLVDVDFKFFFDDKFATPGHYHSLIPSLEYCDELFKYARARGSNYWQRLKLRTAVLVKPIRGWHDASDVYIRYESLALPLEDPST